MHVHDGKGISQGTSLFAHAVHFDMDWSNVIVPLVSVKKNI